MIAESHISIHTFPLRGFVSADVYTCQNSLDTEQICQYFAEAFACRTSRSTWCGAAPAIRSTTSTSRRKGGLRPLDPEERPDGDQPAEQG